MKILLATTNKAKIKFYGTRLKEKGIDLITLSELEITKEIEETGKTPLENAIIKAKGYVEISKMPTIAIDDGLYFNNVPDELQPGVNVRKVNGKRLNDKEMIEHYIGLVNTFGSNGVLEGYFTKGVALVSKENIQSFETSAERTFVNVQSKIVDEGYPLASIQLVPIINKYKSELTREEEALTMDIEHRPIFDFLFKAIDNLEKN